MIVLEAEQGSPEWAQARLGIPTASAFDRIVTKSGKLSGQRDKYMMELLAEWALGVAQDTIPDLYWIERGQAMEGEARAFYELKTDIDARRVGFVWRDERKLVGCSPDWLCTTPDGDVGGAEIKCPKASTHIAYMLGGGVAETYIPQVQGSMWVTGRQWWDFVSYFPDLPPLVVRVARDPAFQAQLDAAIPAFLDEMLQARRSLEDMGVRPGTLILRTQGTDSDAEMPPDWQTPLGGDPAAPGATAPRDEFGLPPLRDEPVEDAFDEAAAGHLPLLDAQGATLFLAETLDEAVRFLETFGRRKGPASLAGTMERNRAALDALRARGADAQTLAAWRAIGGW